MGIENIGGQAGRGIAKVAGEALKPEFWRSLGEKLGLAPDAVTISRINGVRGNHAVAEAVGKWRTAAPLPVQFDAGKWRFLEANQLEGNSPSYWLKSESGERALFKEARHEKVDVKGTAINPEAGNERLASVLGERLELPVNKVQLGTFNGKVGSLHHEVGSTEQPAVQFLRIAKEFGVKMRRGSGHPYRSMSNYERTGAEQLAHWEKLKQHFTNPEIWDRTDFFDQTIHNLRHGENYLLVPKDGKFEVHLIDNGGAFDGQIFDGKLPPLATELGEYRAYLESLRSPERSLYLSHIMDDMKRFAALSPTTLKADVAAIPAQFLPPAYRQSALGRLLEKQKLVREFLAGRSG